MDSNEILDTNPERKQEKSMIEFCSYSILFTIRLGKLGSDPYHACSSSSVNRKSVTNLDSRKLAIHISHNS